MAIPLFKEMNMKNTVIKFAMTSLLMTSCTLALAQDQLKEGAEIHSKSIRAAVDRMGEQDLKGLYLSCSSVASKRLMEIDEAIACSTGAEALKVRVFSGNFEETLAWWRKHKDDEVKDLSDYFNK